jgi:hypothetical protein
MDDGEWKSGIDILHVRVSQTHARVHVNQIRVSQTHENQIPMSDQSY